MNLRPNLLMGALIASMSFLGAGMAFGQAGAACDQVTGVCGLGGQLRAQIGNGLPLPISFAPGATGLITSQPGAILATPSAMVTMQVPAPATGPRSLMMAPGQYSYNDPIKGIGVVEANLAVFSVRTDLSYVNPHPAFGTRTLAAGGRSGPTVATGTNTLPVVTWCAGQGVPNATFNPGCLAPDDLGSGTAPDTNGLIRYTATRNQFGGTTFSQVGGTAMVFFNVGGVAVGDLPCNGVGCNVGISLVNPATVGVNGATFSVMANNPAFMTPTGVFTASVAPNGQVNAVGAPVTVGGNNIPFTGQAATSWGVPQTTGRLTISVTAALGGPEVFVRTGTDGRDANGDGVVVTVSGAVSARSLSGANGNRGWATMRVPEPSAIFAASAGLFALLGAHQLVRRRSN